VEKICNDTRTPSSERHMPPVVSDSFISSSDLMDSERRRDPPRRAVARDGETSRRASTRRKSRREYKNYYVRSETDREILLRKNANLEQFGHQQIRHDRNILVDESLVAQQSLYADELLSGESLSSTSTSQHWSTGSQAQPSKINLENQTRLPGGASSNSRDVALLPVESIHDLRAAVGEYLARLRHEKGKSIRDVSESTKVPADVLQKLEIGDWSDLPAPVFLKGFIRAYVRFVGGSHHIGEERVAKLFGEIKKRDESVPIQIVGDSASELESRRRFGLALFVFILVIIATITFSLLWGNGLDSKMRDIDFYGSLQEVDSADERPGLDQASARA